MGRTFGGDGSNALRNIGYYGFQAVNSAGDSLLRAATTGPYSLALSASATFNDTILDATQKGASTEEAILLGVLNAGIETATEKIPLDNLLDNLGRNPGNWMDILQKAGGQGLIECSTEELSFIGTTLTEAAILRQNSGYATIVRELRDSGLSEQEAIAKANLQVLGEAKEIAITSMLSGEMSSVGSSVIGAMRNPIDPNTVTPPDIDLRRDAFPEQAGTPEGNGWRNAADLARQEDLSVMDALNRAGLQGSEALARANPQAYGQSFQEALKGGASYDQALMRATADAAMKVAGKQVPIDTLLNNIGGDPKKAVSAIEGALEQAGIRMTPGELNWLRLVAAEASLLQEDATFQQKVAVEMLDGKTREEAWTAASEKLWQEATDKASDFEVPSGIRHRIETGFAKAKNKVTEVVGSIRNAIREGRLTIDSTEQQRYELLKDAVIQAVPIKEDAIKGVNLEDYNTRKKSTVIPGFRALARNLGILNVDLNNCELDFPFQFSRRNLEKSLHHQLEYGGSYQDYVKAMSCFNELVENAVPIETHPDKKKGTAREEQNLKQVYVLVSAIQDGNKIIPIQLEVKTYTTGNSQLYMTVALTKVDSGVVEKASATQGDDHPFLFPESTYTLQSFFENVNPKDARFLKYVPDQFLNEAQRQKKQEALDRQEKEYAAYGKTCGRESLDGSVLTNPGETDAPLTSEQVPNPEVADQPMDNVFNEAGNGGYSEEAQLHSQDQAELAEIQAVLGENAPKTLEEFQELKYNSGQWWLFQIYQSEIVNGKLSPLADFPLFLKVGDEADSLLVGATTFDGIQITDKGIHFSSRAIGSIEERRSGVNLEDVLEALTNPNAKILPIKYDKYGQPGQKYRYGNVEVTINPETGKLIQTNPYGSNHKKKGD